MEAANLVRMANQIAAFFAAYPHDQAVTATADHIRQFWDPRMRRQLMEILESGGAGLSQVARAAAQLLRDEAEARARAG
jgi:formate dehydrogenase subunit delta